MGLTDFSLLTLPNQEIKQIAVVDSYQYYILYYRVWIVLHSHGAVIAYTIKIRTEFYAAAI
ncbi:hypothetical protein TI04_05095 [Achromatium sp. WMS2]|nr:hypothetical protein TI04_05095 [Achromatium sp. WMS2]